MGVDLEPGRDRHRVSGSKLEWADQLCEGLRCADWDAGLEASGDYPSSVIILSSFDCVRITTSETTKVWPTVT